MDTKSVAISKISLAEFFRRKSLHLYGIRHIRQYSNLLVIKRLLKKLKFTTVLDAACGSGLYSKYIAAKFPNAKILAVDFFKTCFKEELEKGFQSANRIKFLKEDLTKMTFCDKFDLILHLEAIGGIEDFPSVLANFYKALKHGGSVIINLPVYTNFSKAFKSIGLPCINLSGKPRDLDFGRKKFIEKFIRKMEDIGFEIDAVDYPYGRLGSFAWEAYQLTNELHRAIKLIINPFLKLLVFCDSKIKHKDSYKVFIIARKPLRKK